MCRVFIHGHSNYKNVFALRLICEVVVQRWTFTISLPNFLFCDLYFCLYLYYFSGNATRTPFNYNLSCRMMKCKNKNSKTCDSLSKMPLDECSAAMGYLRFCFVVLIEAIRVILISRQRVSNRSYSAEERIFVFPNSSNQ